MRYISLMVCLFLGACSTAKDTVLQQSDSPWRGKTIQSLEDAWGAPNLVLTASDGTHKFSFVTKKRIAVTEVENNDSATNADPAISTKTVAQLKLMSCTTTVFVDANNIIQNISSVGDLCSHEEYIKHINAID